MQSLNINAGWRFRRNWEERAEQNDFDDQAWQSVDLPHDWSIEGEFSPDAPAYCRGAYLPTGRGMYRKIIRIPAEHRHCRTTLYFGGVYRQAEVFINGHLLGMRPWGYIPFEYDITAFINPAAANLVAVKVDNQAPPMTCRWYSGSGIYRGVTLNFYPTLYFPRWSTVIVAAEAAAGGAAARVQYRVANTLPKRTDFKTVHTVLDRNGAVVRQAASDHIIGHGLIAQLALELPIANPRWWTLEDPYLYTLVSEIYQGEQLVDRTAERFGLRTLRYDADTGFYLNGRRVKIQGMCLHNDGGALGAAVSKATFVRQLAILKTMGCNAVRTAHHPFSEEFLEACDEQGMLVLAEAFDEWQEPCRVGPYSDGEAQSINCDYYARFFDQWAKKDLTDFILRDRNHPSIFMWSIGNEVPQMRKPSGYQIAATLQELIHDLDPSRAVTCAVVGQGLDQNLAILDVGGYNYPSADLLDEYKRRRPRQPILVTEAGSAQAMRPVGEYYPAGQIPELGYRHPQAAAGIRRTEDMRRGIDAWQAVAARDFVMGIFVWTGFDYLGEPTPYDFPAISSFFGVIDRCGFPKDGYYFYRSVWRPEPLVHIAGHWDFKAGEETDLYVISNCPEVELFINEVSRGVHRPGDGFRWRVPFAPGTVRAVGRHPAGSVTDQRTTGGRPASLRLIPDLAAVNPRDAAYLTCEILDEHGNLFTREARPISFTVAGQGALKALDNGSQMSLESFQHSSTRQTCRGRALCIVQAGPAPGTLNISAAAPGLAPAACSLAVRAASGNDPLTPLTGGQPDE